MDIAYVMLHGGSGSGMDSMSHAVGLLCLTLVLAALGRVAVAVTFVKLSCVTASTVFLSSALLSAACSVVLAASCGLAAQSLAIAFAAFFVVAPSTGPRSLLSCFLSVVCVTCVLVCLVLPDRISWMPLALRSDDQAFTAPFAGARLWLHDGSAPRDGGSYGGVTLLPANEQVVIARPIRVAFARVTMSARNRVLLHSSASILSSGADVALRDLDVTLREGAYIALLGSGGGMSNCTVTCERLPCVFLYAPHVRYLSMHSVRLRHSATPEDILVEGDTGELHKENLCSSPLVHCLQPAPNSRVSSLTGQTFDLFQNVSAAMEATECEYSIYGGFLEDWQHFRQTVPLAVVAVEHAPACVAVVTDMCVWVTQAVVRPLLVKTADFAVVFATWCAPWVELMREFLWHFFTVLVCRYPLVPYDLSQSYCIRTLALYEHDPQFKRIDVFVTAVVSWIAEVEGVPLLAPSLRVAFRIEWCVTELLWTQLYWVLLWSLAAVWNIGVLLRPCAALALSVISRGYQLVALSVAHSYNDLDAAVLVNVCILHGMQLVLLPLLVLGKSALAALWAMLAVYGSTAASTQLFVALCQTGLLCLVLYRDFKSRVRQQKDLSQNWLMRTVTSVPTVFISMLRHYSKPVVAYAVVHLVCLVLSLGTSIIPFGAKLHFLALQVVLPTASTYSWLLFFHAPDEPSFWWRVAVRTLGKCFLCVVLQKTVGDVLFHVVSEILIGISVAAVCFAVVVFYGRRRHQQRPSTTPPATVVDAQPARLLEREIH